MVLSSKQDVLLVILVAVGAYWMGTQQAISTFLTTTTTDSAGKGTTTTTRVDPTTGIAFDEKASFFHVHKNLQLRGVGTRKKAILNIYSMGMYVSPPLAKELDKVDTTTGNASICKTILDSKAPRAVQLHMNMGIGPEKIAEAVSGIEGVEEQVRKTFHDMLLEGMGEGKMKSGEVLTFEWKGNEEIFVTVRGSYIGSVKDAALAQGVLALYVGPKSVSPSLRRNLGCE